MVTLNGPITSTDQFMALKQGDKFITENKEEWVIVSPPEKDGNRPRILIKHPEGHTISIRFYASALVYESNFVVSELEHPQTIFERAKVN